MFIAADRADDINAAIEEMGFGPLSLSFSRYGGTPTPEVWAERADEIIIRISCTGEGFEINAINYAEGFGGETDFTTLRALERRLRTE